MQAQLKQIDGSLAVVLPPEIQQRWNLHPGTSLEISIKGTEITIAPCPETSPTEPIDTAIDLADQRYAETFRRLAE